MHASGVCGGDCVYAYDCDCCCNVLAYYNEFYFPPFAFLPLSCSASSVPPAYRPLVTSPVAQPGHGGLLGRGNGHVDIHIHAIVAPTRYDICCACCVVLQ